MGRKLIKGENDLATVFPSIAPYYDENKNGNTASDIQAKSNKDVWWTCDNGHSFSMKVLNRIRREKSCPYCSGQKLLKGFNDLQTVYPEIASEWDYEKNEGTPLDYRYGSGYKAWWLCQECGKSYQSPINIHTRGHKCPYCTGVKVDKGRTDLQTCFPEIAKEYADDNELPASYISASTHKKVKWVCPRCNEKYWASPHHRTSKNRTECPFCKKQSKGERLIKSILKEYDVEYKEQEWFEDLCGDKGRPLKFDFTLYRNHEWLGAIEYQGQQHYEPVAIYGGRKSHKEQTHRDLLKTQYCLERGVPILNVAYHRAGESVADEVRRFLHNLHVDRKDI